MSWIESYYDIVRRALQQYSKLPYTRVEKYSECGIRSHGSVSGGTADQVKWEFTRRVSAVVYRLHCRSWARGPLCLFQVEMRHSCATHTGKRQHPPLVSSPLRYRRQVMHNYPWGVFLLRALRGAAHAVHAVPVG